MGGQLGKIGNYDSRGERSPWLPLETRPDSPGEPGMQPRHPCLPWSLRPLRGLQETRVATREESPGLHSQAVAWRPRRSAGRRESGSQRPALMLGNVPRCGSCAGAVLGTELGGKRTCARSPLSAPVSCSKTLMLSERVLNVRMKVSMIPSAQRFVWAAKQPLGKAALGALFA